jgi:di/tricarboxylate transporter
VRNSIQVARVSAAATTFLVLAAVVVLFVWNRVAVEIVAIGSALSLYFTGVLTLEQALAGFGNATVVFIATLFVVSEGLDATGVTTWAGQELNARAGKSRARLLILMMALVAFLTEIFSLNGAVAALLPVVVLMAVRRGPPSQLLLPLVFAAHAGSLLTLTGTPVNVLLSNVAEESGYAAFGFFEFALVGIPLLAGTMAIVLLFGERLLPHRRTRVVPSDLSAHARTLMQQYALTDGPFRLTVQSRSPCIGRSPAAVDLSEYPGVTLVGAQTHHGSEGADVDALEPNDVLIVRGNADDVRRLSVDQGLSLNLAAIDKSGDRLFTAKSGVAEIVIPPRSDLIGDRVFPGMTSASGDLVILAIQRRGADVTGETSLAAGDTLLVRGTWSALDERVGHPDILVVDAPDVVRRRTAPLGPRAWAAIAVLAGMVVLLATNALPEVVAGLLAAGAMVVLRLVTVEQAYKAISWTTVILVAAMMPLSTAMRESGAAETIAVGLVQAVGNAGPYALLVGVFFLTASLGQLISNMATALIVSPIALSAAAGIGVSARPLLMTIAVAAAASFLTPVATPVNLMVKNPGGYRFGDYWKLGLPLLLWFLVVSIVLVPVFWAF